MEGHRPGQIGPWIMWIHEFGVVEVCVGIFRKVRGPRWTSWCAGVVDLALVLTVMVTRPRQHVSGRSSFVAQHICINSNPHPLSTLRHLLLRINSGVSSVRWSLLNLIEALIANVRGELVWRS